MAQVEELAYALWEARGRPVGDDWTDWFAAEALSQGEAPVMRWPELRFDFMADLRAIYASKLAALGVSVDAGDNAGEVIAKYYSQSYRVIEPVSRRVVWSKELRAREPNLAVDRRQALAAIEAGASSGGVLNPYQSRQLDTKPGAPDAQLLEWGITHFHLGLKRDSRRPNLVEGTTDLLFVVVRTAAVYLVEIFDHKSFSDEQVFNIALINWPELFQHVQMRGAVGLERSVSSEERAELRRAKINVLTVGADGAVYGPVGFGMTTAGTPLAVTQEHVIPLVRHVRELERWCKEKPEEVLANVPPAALEGLTVVDVRLIETPNGLVPAVNIPDG